MSMLLEVLLRDNAVIREDEDRLNRGLVKEAISSNLYGGSLKASRRQHLVLSAWRI